MKYSRITDIFLRYLIVLLSSFKGLAIFYAFFGPLTIYLSYFIFNIFFNVELTGNIISFQSFNIILTDSCIAGAAYFLLFLLNLSVPKVSVNKRILMVFFSFVCFLLINVLRIFFLSVIFRYQLSIFDFVHFAFWMIMSLFFVILIWFLEIKLFKIKEIPFYSDIKYLFSLIKN